MKVVDTSTVHPNDMIECLELKRGSLLNQELKVFASQGSKVFNLFYNIFLRKNKKSCE